MEDSLKRRSPEEERRRMEEGRLYLPTDDSIMEEQTGYLELLYDYNETRPHEAERRQELLKKMFAEIGEDCYIEPPLRATPTGPGIMRISADRCTRTLI